MIDSDFSRESMCWNWSQTCSEKKNELGAGNVDPLLCSPLLYGSSLIAVCTAAYLGYFVGQQFSFWCTLRIGYRGFRSHFEDKVVLCDTTWSAFDDSSSPDVTFTEWLLLPSPKRSSMTVLIFTRLSLYRKCTARRLVSVIYSKHFIVGGLWKS